jgi:hypothetical protein
MTAIQNNLEFVRSDALLLFSIAFTRHGEGASLEDIIAVGDYIDHSIFSGLELRHGLSLLKRAGYIDENEGQFSLAGAAREYWQPLREARKSINTFLKGFNTFLGVDVPSSGTLLDDPHWEYAGLDDESVHRAYLSYINAHSGPLKKA